MKKSNVLFMLAAGAMMLTACGNDETFTNEGGAGQEARQQIVLQVANGGDGISTRAGRPLYSSEAKQSIENVHIIITETGSDKVVCHQNVDKWNTESTPYSENGHGREKIITLSTKLAAGNYHIYAVGHSTDTKYTFTETLTADGSKTFGPNAVLNATEGEEIFAGSVDLTVKEGEGFRPAIVLHRQVAGVFTYLSNIPYYHEGNKEGGIEGSQLRLYAVAKRDNLVLGNFADKDLTTNGQNTTTNVINGGTQTEAKTLIYTIDLKKWFKVLKDANNDRLIDTYTTTEGQFDNWQNPHKQQTPDGKTYYESTFVKGSVFGGNFLIPFQSVEGKDTFQLEMTDATGNHVFQTWVIKLKASDTPATLAKVWDGKKFTDTPVKDNANSYCIFRNQLYGVGTKIKDGETTPTPDPTPDPNPEQPDPEDNKPTPIDKKQELTLRVNDNWEVLHDMEIE